MIKYFGFYQIPENCPHQETWKEEVGSTVGCSRNFWRQFASKDYNSLSYTSFLDCMKVSSNTHRNLHIEMVHHNLKLSSDSMAAEN